MFGQSIRKQKLIFDYQIRCIITMILTGHSNYHARHTGELNFEVSHFFFPFLLQCKPIMHYGPPNE